MATIRNKWLKLSKENYPAWWKSGQIVRIKPYEDGKAFILMPAEETRRIPGYSKITSRNQLLSNGFIDGDYKIIPYDGGSIIIYPIKQVDPEQGNNESEDINESESKLDIDPFNCSAAQMNVWARYKAVMAVEQGAINKSLVGALQFAIEMAEKVDKQKPKQLSSPDDQDSLKILREMAADKTISESVRSGILKELLKRETKTGANRIRKTMVMEVKDNESNS